MKRPAIIGALIHTISKTGDVYRPIVNRRRWVDEDGTDNAVDENVATGMTIGLTANAFDPGAMRTGLGRGTGWLADSPERAAAHLVQLAVNCRYAAANGLLFREGQPQASRLARETELQEKLWAASLKLAGLVMMPARH